MAIKDSDKNWEKEPWLWVLLRATCNPRKSSSIQTPRVTQIVGLWKNSGFQPEDLTPNSGQKVWWKCPVSDDHYWEAVPYSMTMKTRSKFCPFCNGRKVSITNCLATTHPSFIRIWHPTKNGKLTPWNVTAGSDRKVWFICANDASHEYQGIIYNMTRPFRRKFCPHCGVKGMITRPVWGLCSQQIAINSDNNYPD